MSAASSGAVKAPEFANSFTFSDNDIEGKIEKKTKKELWFFDWQPREQLVASFSAIARSLLVMHQTTILTEYTGVSVPRLRRLLSLSRPI